MILLLLTLTFVAIYCVGQDTRKDRELKLLRQSLS